jgi:hypothetical protein
MNLRLRAAKKDWSPRIQFGLFEANGDTYTAVATSFTMKTTESADYVEPAFNLSMEAAQVLIDDLWHAGLRPSEGTGSAGQLAAVERHLRDMQHIALGLLAKHMPTRIETSFDPAFVADMARRRPT